MSGVFFCDKCSNLYDIGQDKNGNDIFICNSCGDSKKIESGTLFLSKGESINDNVNVNKKKEAKALMHTSNYICPNKDCPSHKAFLCRTNVFVCLSSFGHPRSDHQGFLFELPEVFNVH